MGEARLRRERQLLVLLRRTPSSRRSSVSASRPVSSTAANAPARCPGPLAASRRAAATPGRSSPRARGATTSCSSPAIRVRSSSTAAAASSRRRAPPRRRLGLRAQRAVQPRAVAHAAGRRASARPRRRRVEKMAFAIVASPARRRGQRDQPRAAAQSAAPSRAAALEHGAGACRMTSRIEKNGPAMWSISRRRAGRRRGSRRARARSRRAAARRRRATPERHQRGDAAEPDGAGRSPRAGARTATRPTVSARHDGREQRVEPPGRAARASAQHGARACGALCRAARAPIPSSRLTITGSSLRTTPAHTGGERESPLGATTADAAPATFPAMRTWTATTHVDAGPGGRARPADRHGRGAAGGRPSRSTSTDRRPARLRAGSRVRVSGSLVGRRVGFDVEVHEAARRAAWRYAPHGPVAHGRRLRGSPRAPRQRGLRPRSPSARAAACSAASGRGQAHRRAPRRRRARRRRRPHRGRRPPH